MRLLAAVAVAVVVALAASGCGSDRRAADAPATGASPSAAVVRDAAALGAKLSTAGVGVVGLVVQDAATDPNHLLGRPGGYTSRASFDLTGGDEEAPSGDVARGGVLEVFPTEADARRRAAYIGGIVAAAPELAGEYDYQHGTVLLRIAGTVIPHDASRVDAALVVVLPG